MHVFESAATGCHLNHSMRSTLPDMVLATSQEDGTKEEMLISNEALFNGSSPK
jgi:hypothetical protein